MAPSCSWPDPPCPTATRGAQLAWGAPARPKFTPSFNSCPKAVLQRSDIPSYTHLLHQELGRPRSDGCWHSEPRQEQGFRQRGFVFILPYHSWQPARGCLVLHEVPLSLPSDLAAPRRCSGSASGPQEENSFGLLFETNGYSKPTALIQGQKGKKKKRGSNPWKLGLR